MARRGALIVDHADVLVAAASVEALREVAYELQHRPGLVLASAGLAAYRAVCSAAAAEADDARDPATASECTTDATGDARVPPAPPAMVRVRVRGLEPVTPLSQLKSNYVGRLVSVRGTVLRVGYIKPLVTRMAFECNRCGATLLQPLPDGRFQTPSRCTGDRCKSRSFTPLRRSPHIATIDWQTIRCAAPLQRRPAARPCDRRRGGRRETQRAGDCQRQ